ncbi:hypothetical protein [Aeromonas taiwanensis]|uniref:hypothetical protein n=1 Tax=Aeromonas taiwanensis TaxID=633417 RepID=UPI00248D5288|nr:hypothetical protein [Aeromonas taiwanensis]
MSPNLCRWHFISILVFANIVERDASSIRQQHLKAQVGVDKLKLAFPQYKTNSKQGYIAIAEHLASP